MTHDNTSDSDISPEIIVEEERIEYVIEALGGEITEDGYVKDAETGERIPTPEGNYITTDEIGFISTSDGENPFVLVPDTVSDIRSCLETQKAE